MYMSSGKCLPPRSYVQMLTPGNKMKTWALLQAARHNASKHRHTHIRDITGYLLCIGVQPCIRGRQTHRRLPCTDSSRRSSGMQHPASPGEPRVERFPVWGIGFPRSEITDQEKTSTSTSTHELLFLLILPPWESSGVWLTTGTGLETLLHFHYYYDFFSSLQVFHVAKKTTKQNPDPNS